MAASTLVDLVKIQIASLGNGPLLLGSPVAQFRGADKLSDGKTYSYSIQHDGGFEIGQGVYEAATGTLTRSPADTSNGGLPLFLTAGAIVTFTALATDLDRAAQGGALVSQNNLSDVADPAQAFINLGGNRALIQTVSTFFTIAPQTNEVMLMYLAVVPISFALDFEGSNAFVGVNPTAQVVFDIKKNGVTIGTMTIAITGGVTFTSGTPVELTDGDVLSIVAPSSADATLANVAITLKGSL